MNVDDLVMGSTDPFSDHFEDIHTEEKIQPIFATEIHIRVVKRNTRKCITSVEGLDEYKVDLQKVIKAWKKKFSCNGAIKTNVITLQGDKRDEIYNFCLEELEIKKDNIKIHGF